MAFLATPACTHLHISTSFPSTNFPLIACWPLSCYNSPKIRGRQRAPVFAVWLQTSWSSLVMNYYPPLILPVNKDWRWIRNWFSSQFRAQTGMRHILHLGRNSCRAGGLHAWVVATSLSLVSRTHQFSVIYPQRGSPHWCQVDHSHGASILIFWNHLTPSHLFLPPSREHNVSWPRY